MPGTIDRASASPPPRSLLDQWFEALGTKAHHSGDKRLNRTGNLKVLDQSCNLRIPLY